MATEHRNTISGGEFHDTVIGHVEGGVRIGDDRSERADAENERSASTAGELRRNVLVVHGRDDNIRGLIFDFLRCLYLRPLGWENLVNLTGTTAPTVFETIARALPLVHAVVAVMTPDDIVQLHPSLASPGRVEVPGLQARPNVLLELGMALVSHAEKTMIVEVGDLRPVTDLAGVSTVRIVGPAERRRRALNTLRGRLASAGCPIDEQASWLHLADDARWLDWQTRHIPSPVWGPEPD